MYLGLTADYDSISGVGDVIDEMSEATKDYFRSRDYGAGSPAIAIVLMCQSPSLNLKQRLRFKKKENILYTDVMLSLDEMCRLSPKERERIIGIRIADTLREILKKYVFKQFDAERFLHDFNHWWKEKPKEYRKDISELCSQLDNSSNPDVLERALRKIDSEILHDIKNISPSDVAQLINSIKKLYELQNKDYYVSLLSRFRQKELIDFFKSVLRQHMDNDSSILWQAIAALDNLDEPILKSVNRSGSILNTELNRKLANDYLNRKT